MDFRLELDGMKCESCEKTVRRVAEQNGASVSSVDAKSGTVAFSCEEGAIDAIMSGLMEKGYKQRGAGASPRGNPSRVKDYVFSVIAGDGHVSVEASLLNHGIGSAAVLIALGGIAFAALSASVPYSGAYVPLLLLLALGSIATIFSYSHMGCYKSSISCMNGMMVGMTIGMMSGFMFGALVGATNGMFMGSVAGMAVGIVLGGNVGRFCGVMGAMEGVMAGLMGGLMGAMTSVMLINDNLVAFLYLLFGVCIFVMGGLSYMMYREAGPAPERGLAAGFGRFFLSCAALSLIIGMMMVFGPKGLVSYP
jgi:hypothetical protein